MANIETETKVSRAFIAAVKLAPEPAYRIAQKADITAPVLSRMLHGAERLKPQDPRVLAVAQIVGVPPEDAFA